MRNRTVFLLMALFLLASCGPAVNVTRLNNAIAPQYDSGPLEVYTSPEAVGRPYQEVALIRLDRASVLFSDQDMLNVALEEARKVGANAIILLGQGTQSSGGTFVPNGYYGGSYIESREKVMQATAIAYTTNPTAP